MKILMICDFFHENQQYQENLLVKYYLKHGHVVTIVASTFTSIFEYYSENYKREIKPQSYNINGYKVIRLPYSINLFNKLRKLKNLDLIIVKEAPDFIYVHGMPLNLINPLDYKKKNPLCKVVYDSHADYSNSAKTWLSFNILHKIIYRIILKRFYRKIDKIFFITPDSEIFLNQMYGIPNNLMTLLPLGSDTDYIHKINETGTSKSIRNKLGINQNDFVIFTGGKFLRIKKIELAIKSFVLIESHTAHLIIVGDTKDDIYKKEILELINSHERIHFIGWVEGEEVYDYMTACDIAVFPASHSVLWQQAIGSGLPLIIGQMEGQDATYLNINNSMFIIEQDFVTEEKIYSLLKLLMDDKNLLTSMKMNAVKTTEELLSYDRIALYSLES